MTRAIPFLLALLLAPAAQAAVPAVQAHRGGPVIDGVPTYPEETMPAFRNAAEELHTVLEIDAKLTEDRVPVVIHDDTLERTTNCEGLVADRTLAELAECKADVLGAPGNDLKTAPAPEPVPIATLAEVLAFAREVGIGINLEIKNYPTDDDFDPTAGFANRIMDVVLESKIPAKQVIIQSFTPANLDVAEARMPEAELAFLALAGSEDPAMDVAATRGWDWISPSWPVDKDYVDEAHSRNLRVVPYTINQADAVSAAAKAGVDAVITDDPLMALKALDTKPTAVVVKARTKRLAAVKRKGKLPVRMSSNEPATVELTVRLGGKPVGRASVAFEAAGSQRFAVRLSRAGRKALKKRETRAKLVLVAKSLDLAQNRGTARAVARLRA
jgi:glycerophosphoryl diester phosphodiesterase